MDFAGILMYMTLLTTPKDLPADWKAIAMCESSLNPKAISPTGKFMGLFQFSQASWEFVGQQGKPHEANWVIQYKAARDLHKIQGWKAWPTCAKKTGLI
jgi:membrane-bound lytic murein transglycosylase MltF